MRKKHKGSTMEAIFVLFIIMALAIVMSAFIFILQLASKKEDVKELGRNYLLVAETYGYVPPASKTELIQKLTDLGATDIDLNGTTFTDAGYGNPVYISIQCNLHVNILDTTENDMLQFSFIDNGHPVAVHKMSTAKN